MPTSSCDGAPRPELLARSATSPAMTTHTMRRSPAVERHASPTRARPRPRAGARLGGGGQPVERREHRGRVRRRCSGPWRASAPARRRAPAARRRAARARAAPRSRIFASSAIDCFALERRAPGEALEEHAAEREHVRARRDVARARAPARAPCSRACRSPSRCASACARRWSSRAMPKSSTFSRSTRRPGGRGCPA